MTSKNNAATQSQIESLEKVRDILFGSKSRELEKRFTRLETLIEREAARTRKEFAKSIETLEKSTRAELDSLAKHLAEEVEAREAGEEEFEHEIAQFSKGIEKRLAQLENSSGKGFESLKGKLDTLKADLTEASAQWKAKFAEHTEELAVSIEEEAEELREQKLDRADAAAIFADLAKRLGAATGK